MTTIEALQEAIDTLEAMARGKTYTDAEWAGQLQRLKAARDQYFQVQQRDAQRQAQIRALSALARTS